MTARIGTATTIWRGRAPVSNADRAYAVYLGVLVLLVTVVPTARALWLAVTDSELAGALASADAPAVTSLGVALLWALALLVGRERGPAVLPPFLAFTFGTSDLSRSRAFRRPALLAGILITASAAAVAGSIGAVLVVRGDADLRSAVIFAVAGASIGAIAATGLLLGQAFPRTALAVAAVLITVGSVTSAVPSLLELTPWGWVALCYPSGGAPAASAGVLALAVGSVCFWPALMNRLTLAALLSHSIRWESAVAHATTVELGTAAAVYRGRPYAARRVRATRGSRMLWLTFLQRDAIGAVRTPGRLVLGVAAVAAAMILLAWGSGSGWAVGAAAGVLLLAGVGPFSDGVRHAASVASDLPLYGVGDGHLLALHSVFPVTVTLLVVLAAATVVATAGASLSALPTVIGLAALAVVLRISAALKGPLPPVLLSPIPTPMGDLGAAARVMWALDALILAALAGAAAASGASLALAAVVTIALGTCIHRWLRRR